MDFVAFLFCELSSGYKMGEAYPSIVSCSYVQGVSPLDLGKQDLPWSGLPMSALSSLDVFLKLFSVPLRCLGHLSSFLEAPESRWSEDLTWACFSPGSSSTFYKISKTPPPPWVSRIAWIPPGTRGCPMYQNNLSTFQAIAEWIDPSSESYQNARSRGFNYDEQPTR